MSLRAARNRQLHRIIGTGIGLLVTWTFLPLIQNAMSVAAAMVVLIFLIETAIVRNYGFAAIFFTPMGAFIGFLGATCLHRPAFRAHAAQ